MVVSSRALTGGLLVVFLILLGFSGVQASQDQVSVATFLSLSLDQAQFESERKVDGKKGVVSDDRFFQPYYFAGSGGSWSGLHRRVTLYDRSRAFRDRREALVVPVPSSLRFPVKAEKGNRFVVNAVPLVTGGASIKVEWEILCDDEKMFSQTAAAVPPGSINVWPSAVQFEVTRDCAEITLKAKSSGDSRSDRAVVVWEGARIEHRRTRSAAPQYNIVFVVVDALRADVIGHRRTEFPSVSPHMDALEKSGTSFSLGFANGNTTLLSMNAMLLGTHPRALDFLTLWWSNQDRREQFYKRNPPFLPLLLQRAGYVSLTAVHNHLFFPPYSYSVDPGFAVMMDSGRDTTDHPILTDEAIRFMKENRDRRFLLQLGLLGPHQPYSPPKECLDRAKKALGGDRKGIHIATYIGEVCWVDEHVGQLVKAIRDLGLDKETIIVLTADHGEVMDREHACTSNRDGSRSMHLHGVTLYNEELNVPILFALPGTIKAQISRLPVQHVDIVPTVLNLLGLPVPAVMTGRSLKPVLADGQAMEEVPIYSERWLSRSLYHKGWKLIWHSRKDSCCAPAAGKACQAGRDWGELYHLETDMVEHNELSAKHPERLKELQKIIEETRERFYQMSGGTGPNP
jgi:arylsulfatase A-like enzyme